MGKVKMLRHRHTNDRCKRKNCRGRVGAKTLSPAPGGTPVLLNVCDNCGREYGSPYLAPTPEARDAE